MSSAEQIAANRANAQAATGPRTSSGKARSSRNAVTHGLYAEHDFIGLDKREEYLKLRAALRREFAPETAAEHVLVAEILHAKWRLRRCAEVESRLMSWATFEPVLRESSRINQASIKLARRIANRLLRRSTDELHLLQTDRLAGNGIVPNAKTGRSNRRLLTFA